MVLPDRLGLWITETMEAKYGILYLNKTGAQWHLLPKDCHTATSPYRIND
jgi:hypothetical protein